jgi:antirestriction protein ArdC
MASTLTDQERQQRREQDRQRMLDAVAALTSSEGWQAWLSTRRRFHRYSFINQLLIVHQCPHATRVAGFRAWLKLGYCVRRGETALRIYAPVPPTKKEIEQWKADGADPDAKPRVRFRASPVFDRSQVDELADFPGGPAPLDPPIEPLIGDTLHWAHEPLCALGAEIGSTITFESVAGTAAGYYVLETKAIVIDPAASINAQIATLVHELAHALVRADHQPSDPVLDYASEELIVESVAYTVCGSLGLDSTGSSAPYIASWAQSADLAIIEATASLIDRLARRIENSALPHHPDQVAEISAASQETVAA